LSFLLSFAVLTNLLRLEFSAFSRVFLHVLLGRFFGAAAVIMFISETGSFVNWHGRGWRGNGHVVGGREYYPPAMGSARTVLDVKDG